MTQDNGRERAIRERLAAAVSGGQTGYNTLDVTDAERRFYLAAQSDIDYLLDRVTALETELASQQSALEELAEVSYKLAHSFASDKLDALKTENAALKAALAELEHKLAEAQALRQAYSNGHRASVELGNFDPDNDEWLNRRNEAFSSNPHEWNTPLYNEWRRGFFTHDQMRSYSGTIERLKAAALASARDRGDDDSGEAQRVTLDSPTPIREDDIEIDPDEQDRGVRSEEYDAGVTLARLRSMPEEEFNIMFGQSGEDGEAG